MKNQKQDEELQKKPATRYDQKMERRKIEAEKNAKNEKAFNLACIAACVVVVAAIAVGVTTSVINKNKAINDTYIKVGDHEITRLEYEYYFQSSSNNYINTYGSFLSYMGLDVNKDYADQPYSDTMSWKDAFDEMAVAQLTQTKAMADDARANGYTADTSAEYDSFVSSMEQAAQANNVSAKRYYKASFGQYATKAGVEPFIKESLLTEAYYNYLLEQKAPTAEDVDIYYAENKNNYDTVSYRIYAFDAELAEGATEEQIAEAMQQNKAKAEEMKTRREAGADFRELCLEYSDAAQKATYENTETDASMTENASYSATPTAYQEWLFDESRLSGDITVAADEASNRYYVVEFASRTQSETYEETISSTLASERVSEYITALTETYVVTDLSGELVYLTVQEETETIAE
ncbi:MAG: hypothetical protein ACRDBO_07040 [Lachnospiraceae bacterium]